MTIFGCFDNILTCENVRLQNELQSAVVMILCYDNMALVDDMYSQIVNSLDFFVVSFGCS